MSLRHVASSACRIRVLRSLPQQFSTPEEDEQFFAQQSKENVDSSQQCHDNGQQIPRPYNIEEEASSEVSTEGSIPIQSVDTLRPIIQQVCMMETEDGGRGPADGIVYNCSSAC